MGVQSARVASGSMQQHDQLFAALGDFAGEGELHWEGRFQIRSIFHVSLRERLSLWTRHTTRNIASFSTARDGLSLRHKQSSVSVVVKKQHSTAALEQWNTVNNNGRDSNCSSRSGRRSRAAAAAAALWRRTSFSFAPWMAAQSSDSSGAVPTSQFNNAAHC